MNRITQTFARLAQSGKKAFSPFLMSGYPDKKTFEDLLKICSETGVDFIEVGMPFSDPSADGAIIKKAGELALQQGASIQSTLDSIKKFREYDNHTPIIWMGYFNAIYTFGTEAFAQQIAAAGIDGLLVVDLPIEESWRISHLKAKNIAPIRLVTPLTTADRAQKIVDSAAGFLYFVSIAGITGTKEAESAKIESLVGNIKKQTDLPVVVGFGIKTPQKAKQIQKFADGAIVGSALVQEIDKHLDEDKKVKNRASFLKNIKKHLQSYL